MPDQPSDPIHYDMKIPPEPKDHEEEERHSAKKHGDKINSGPRPADTDVNRAEEKPESHSGS